MTPRHFILATAGHVDHGKSALVHALTGTDPDRLPEEKTRGITIDLGFAFLQLKDAAGGGAENSTSIGIIDVPGHEDFIRNMAAGLAAVDAALLVVAADDGPMPQTREHLEILAYRGVRRLLVAISKSDLTDPLPAADATRALLARTPFANAPLLPVSVKTSTGIDALRAALAHLLAAAPAPPDMGKPRLWVDRVFAQRGVGTVVTGTLSGGHITRGQTLLLQPAGVRAHVRAAQTHGRDLDHALPGMRTALNLPELAGIVRRGDTLTIEGLGEPSAAWGVGLWRLGLTGDRPLRNAVRVHVHHGSADLAGMLDLLDGGLARLRLDAPAFALPGDRFLLRDWSATRTLAGGILLDTRLPRSGWRKRAASWRERMESPDDPVAWGRSELSWNHAVAPRELLNASRFSRAEIEAAVESLLAAQALRRVGDPPLLVDAVWWDALRTQAIACIDAHHLRHPEQRGLPLTVLRAALGRDLPATAFDTLLFDLHAVGIRRAGDVAARVAHRPALPAPLQRAGTSLREQLARQPLDPPTRKQLAPDAAARAALAFLLDTGEAVEVSPELVLLAETADRAAELVRAHLRTHGRATVSELKQALGSNRRVMVPLVEYLDQRGVTRRVGDYRVPGDR